MNNLSAAELGFYRLVNTILTIVLAVLVAPYAQEYCGRTCGNITWCEFCKVSRFTILCPTILPHSYHYAVNGWRFFRCHRCRYCGGASPTSAVFSIGRVCLGISQGFVQAASTNMSEIASRNIRGRIVCIWQITRTIGVLIPKLIALKAQKHCNLGFSSWLLIATSHSANICCGGDLVCT